MMSDRSLVAKENDERKLDPSPSLYRETYKDLSRLTTAYGERETIYLRRICTPYRCWRLSTL